MRYLRIHRTHLIASNDESKVKKSGRKMDRFSQHLQDKGLQAADIPKAIIVHELLGFTMLFLTWSLCFFYPPSQTKLLKKPVERVLSMMPSALSNSVASNGFLSSRMGSSYIESSCLRKIIRPATFPMKLFLTYEIVCATKNIRFGFHNSTAATSISSTGVSSRDSSSDRKEGRGNGESSFIPNTSTSNSRICAEIDMRTLPHSDFTSRLLASESLF